MNRQREHISIAAENRRRPISLMHVRIHHHRPLDHLIETKPLDRHRHIMNHAKSLAMIRIRMMKSSADIRRISILHRALPRQNRPPRRQPASVNQFLRVRHFHLQHFRVRKRPRLQLPHVLLRMDPQNIRVRRRLRRAKNLLRPQFPPSTISPAPTGTSAKEKRASPDSNHTCRRKSV